MSREAHVRFREGLGLKCPGLLTPSCSARRSGRTSTCTFVLDVFSRYVVGWLVADAESSLLAERLITDAYDRHGIKPGQLGVHADRGPSMKSNHVAMLLANLGITKTHSRPHVSDDNPYSEAQFKTLKYLPDFPERFGCIEDSQQGGSREVPKSCTHGATVPSFHRGSKRIRMSYAIAELLACG